MEIDSLVSSVVDCILQHSPVKPLRIVLFGSAAREEVGDSSDLDFLVILPDGIPCRKTAQRLYTALIEIPCAVDLVVVNEGNFNRLRDNPSLVYYPAAREGRDVYAA